ncbi:hypothetical protein CCMSSC00406_0004466 [Pleurotus cornucopiae]|uniref:Uncharacterized protein n=1 Tax=Pleurotus cornucopiae TaxID=5321 RepID=A0ACB7J2X6_PLECO|nr:hypothetical protein CCMSSC00406_0004466 [Pleurotus cornucopiae]
MGTWWIRANQGHSLPVDSLDLQPIISADQVEMAVHGTSSEAWDSIALQGLSRMNRNHIHLARHLPDSQPATAISGLRAGSDIFVYINLHLALSSGIKFFLSANGVVLTPGDEAGLLHPRLFEKVERACIRNGHVDRPITCHEDHVREITLMIVEFLGAILSCIVKSAYVARIWHLSDRSKLLAGVIMFPTLCEFGLALVIIGGLIFEATGQGLGLCAFGGPFETEDGATILQALYQIPRYAQLSASLISDGLITLSMFYYLKGGLKSNFFSTKSIITLLISYTLAIGLVTSILSIASLALFASRSKQAYFPLVHFMISNVYVNSFLASLNWRIGLRKAGESLDPLSTQGSLRFATRKEESTA